MRKRSRIDLILAVLVVVGFAVVFGGGWWVHSFMEASAYNRITGSDVSTWEAMWVNLRVEAPAQQTESSDDR